MNIDLYGEEITVICPRCDGDGDIFTQHCPLCEGEGEIQAIAKDEFEVDLEPRRLEL